MCHGSIIYLRRLGLFINKSNLLKRNPSQPNYGVIVTDVAGNGRFSFFVCGYGGPNLIYQWDGDSYTAVTDGTLADFGRMAIGMAAGDFDGDGREEIYVLNTDTFAGQKQFADRLFDAVGDEWIDLFMYASNQEVRNLTAGRSVVAVDRRGSGQYGFYVANYGGYARFYELDADGNLEDIGFDIGVDLVTGGRGAIALPLVSDKMDIFAANERGVNFLFRNLGDGTYREEAHEHQIADPDEHGRGISYLDSTGNGRFDIVYGNWEGPHRFYIQGEDGIFIEKASEAMAEPSKIRTVIAADFDNDGYEEIFFNNLGQPNRLFRQVDGEWVLADIGEAAEPDGFGTGAAVADLDGDGRLELLIAHGEMVAQPLTLYQTAANDNYWLRVLPRTRFGAPARGAVVEMEAGGRVQKRAIDAGSGYLCQMEPVAHFGLGKVETVEKITVKWPDGASRSLETPEVCQLIEIAYPD